MSLLKKEKQIFRGLWNNLVSNRQKVFTEKLLFMESFERAIRNMTYSLPDAGILNDVVVGTVVSVEPFFASW